MSKFKVGQRVKLIRVDNPKCGWDLGAVGTIEAVDIPCDCGNPNCAPHNKVRMDVRNKHAAMVDHLVAMARQFDPNYPGRDHHVLQAFDDDLVPLDKPGEASWEEMGFHPNDFLKEKVT